jgi:hypothetical protein
LPPPPTSDRVDRAHFDRIRPGMNRADVEALVGPPGITHPDRRAITSTRRGTSLLLRRRELENGQRVCRGEIQRRWRGRRFVAIHWQETGTGRVGQCPLAGQASVATVLPGLIRATQLGAAAQEQPAAPSDSRPRNAASPDRRTDNQSMGRERGRGAGTTVRPCRRPSPFRCVLRAIFQVNRSPSPRL